MKRLLSAKQRDWLAKELATWKSQSLLSGDQASKILGLYETAEDLSDRKHSILLTTLMALAALMVGLAVFLLVGYNWEDIPRVGKLLLILGTISATYAGAFFAQRAGKSKGTVDVVLFLGSLFYGAGIFLVAQIFHLNAHYPNAFWWWAVGVMPLVLCRGSLLLDAFYAALLALWCGMEIINFQDLGFWLFGRWDDLPNGAYTMLLLAIPALLAGYARRSPGAVTLYLTALVWWVVLQPFAWKAEFEMIYFIGAVGALLIALAELHGSKSLYAIPYRTLGTLLVAGVLALLSFHDLNEDLLRERYGHSPQAAAIIQASAIAVLMVLAFLPSTARMFNRLADPAKPALPYSELIRIQALPLFLSGTLLVSLLWTLATKDAIVPTVLANLGMLALAWHLIRIGLREDRGKPFAVGVMYFLLWTILRYVDLFGDFGGMLGASAMFFVCGGVLFGVGRYWQLRKREAA